MDYDYLIKSLREMTLCNQKKLQRPSLAGLTQENAYDMHTPFGWQAPFTYLFFFILENKNWRASESMF